VGTQAKELLDRALRLSVKDRAHLAAELIASVDGEPDADAQEAWAVEIEKRARRALTGESRGTDWKIVRRRIQKRSTKR
jgi:hypothetical protein